MEKSDELYTAGASSSAGDKQKPLNVGDGKYVNSAAAGSGAPLTPKKCPFSLTLSEAKASDKFPVPKPFQPPTTQPTGKLACPPAHFGPRLDKDLAEHGIAPPGHARDSNAAGASQAKYMRLMSLNKGSQCSMQRTISRSEVANHSSSHDAWTIIDGNVYDISSYLQFHPGGENILMKHAAGKDCTALFNKYHPWVNHKMLLQGSKLGMAGDATLPTVADETNREEDDET